MDNHYLLPVLRNLLMCLVLGSGNKVFSHFDLVSGYCQVPMEIDIREVTAFSTPTGFFERTRTPFGLKGARFTFQRTMNHILGK